MYQSFRYERSIKLKSREYGEHAIMRNVCQAKYNYMYAMTCYYIALYTYTSQCAPEYKLPYVALRPFIYMVTPHNPST